MDLRVVHGAGDSFAGNMFGPGGETQFVDFRNREDMKARRAADVKHKPFTQPVYRTSKELDRRQTVTASERHNGVQRPEFTR